MLYFPLGINLRYFEISDCDRLYFTYDWKAHFLCIWSSFNSNNLGDVWIRLYSRQQTDKQTDLSQFYANTCKCIFQYKHVLHNNINLSNQDRLLK